MPRLLVAARSSPELVGDLLEMLPENAATFDAVEALLTGDVKWRDRREADGVRTWLMRRCRYHREELVRAASLARDEQTRIDHEEDLRALAKLDAPGAEALLARMQRGDQPRTAALATALAYETAMARGDATGSEALRQRLKTIAESGASPAHARYLAALALLSSEWDGRKEWFVARLGDRHFQELEEGNTLYNPLPLAARKEPSFWIPVLVPLVGNSNRALHDGAVACLGTFHLEDARADALRPLLPWLAHPGWASDRWTLRLRLIQSLDRVDLPECVSGLDYVLRHGGDYEVQGAADAVRKYRVRDAVPELRRALRRIRRQYHRASLFAALDRLGALSLDEKVRGVAAFVERPPVKFHEDELPDPASLGLWVLEHCSADEALAKRLLARAPKVIAAVVKWDNPAVRAFLVDRMASGAADGAVLQALLDQREAARKEHREQFITLAHGTGWSAGLASAALEDNSVVKASLAGSDAQTHRGLLAAARYIDLDLPLLAVSPMLRATDAALATAAREYLLTRTSADARRMLESDSPSDFVITGERPHPSSICQKLEPLAEWESKLKDELRRRDGPDEILALIQQYSRIILRRSGSSVTLSVQDGFNLDFTREVPVAELEQLRTLIHVEKIEELPPLAIMDCHSAMSAEYLHLSRVAGRRLFIVTPWFGDSPYHRLLKAFSHFARRDSAMRYDALRENAGLQMIFDEEAAPVDAVWARGNDVRVQLVDRSARGQSPTWIGLKDGHRIGSAHTPDPWSRDDTGPVLDGFPACYGIDHRPYWTRGRDFHIKAGGHTGTCGLWRLPDNSAPVLVRAGVYGKPVVTPDGAWVVAAKAAENWGPPNWLVRIELRTGREHRVAIPAADDLDPLAYCGSRGAVLVFRKEPERPSRYFLVDPPTGRVQPVEGEMTPWEQMERRGLQATARADEVWAAIWREKSNTTEIGRYDLARFAFTPVRALEGLRFGSRSLWVDAPVGCAYFVVRDKVFRVPLTR